MILADSVGLGEDALAGQETFKFTAEALRRREKINSQILCASASLRFQLTPGLAGGDEVPRFLGKAKPCF